MRSILLACAAALIVAGAVAFSRQGTKAPFEIKTEDRNPWTKIDLNNDPRSFQFAIVSDRTGGHRAKIFSQTVDRLNLLQPEFVLSVGDLIEGGAKPAKRLTAEWEEFDGYVKKLQMPFFYVSGNHDVGAKESDAVWQERYGRRWYHFVYRDTLFLCLNSDDGQRVGVGRLSKEQVDYAKATLAANADVRWTMVFIHKPIWTAADPANRGWIDVEKALAGRKYTVFCGHVHRYQKFVRQGMAYYQLATTGGGSKLRGLEYGEFDHIAWITMKKDGPVIANIMVDSVLPDDLKTPESSEEGTINPATKLKTHPIRGYVYLDGIPLVGAGVVLRPADAQVKGRSRPGADGRTEGDGSFRLTTYASYDGAPVGKYKVVVTKRNPDRNDKTASVVPEKYTNVTTTDLEIEVKEGGGEFTLNLKR